MGFFDELEEEVRLPDDPGDRRESAALAAAIDRIAAGTPWEGWLAPPPGRTEGPKLSQHARIAFEGGRFVVTHSFRRARRDAARDWQDRTVVRVDREGLVELLRDQPQLARRLVEDAGGVVDPDHPDGTSALE